MSRWSSIPAGDAPEGLILFDGVCVFCSRWVRFVLDHDRDRLFRFVAIQSRSGRELAAVWSIDPERPQTNAVVMNGRVWFKSDAALKVLGALPATRWMDLLAKTPKTLRDLVYDHVATNRYRIFGRTNACMIPSPQDRDRFLDA